ncbi:hypothetical protein K437DRAFT_81191 [Tilletiaria anomala UBC 951]|uniref:Uncharacterized protein n=1 Tax=Tilletiaria anomala (strain ATCC 24038 / CBS 436.72 / UBC 951) TaxID=1037660 RepID=A0A066W8M8_TILAU|nr:uncharacterized protein K437DRAFT_81191 [Tilletiaria anomala UBC 951]KDN48863.1 hypothetical protein K437DRAFT_81191 [Tilletiaria anomala UBC 951]
MHGVTSHTPSATILSTFIFPHIVASLVLSRSLRNPHHRRPLPFERGEFAHTNKISPSMHSNFPTYREGRSRCCARFAHSLAFIIQPVENSLVPASYCIHHPLFVCFPVDLMCLFNAVVTHSHVLENVCYRHCMRLGHSEFKKDTPSRNGAQKFKQVAKYLVATVQLTAFANTRLGTISAIVSLSPFLVFAPGQDSLFALYAISS